MANDNINYAFIKIYIIFKVLIVIAIIVYIKVTHGLIT